MFSDFIFLVIVLVLINFSPEAGENGWVISSSKGLWIGSALAYTALLVWISLQNKCFKKRLFRNKEPLQYLTNFYLIAFLACLLFILGVPRTSSLALIGIFSLSIYFLGLFVFHVSAYPYLSPKIKNNYSSPIHYSLMQLRLISPLAFPFLIFSFLLDCWEPQSDTPVEVAATFVGTAAFLLVILFFFPPILQKIWQCTPIHNQEMQKRLKSLCDRAQFKHGGMRTWTVMNHAYTAAIIGVLPRFRYVMFSQKLLDALPPESVEAILAHEIGHNARKHLLIYPFILMGIFVSTGLFALFFSESIETFFIQQKIPSPVGSILYPFAFFVPYLMIVFLYFRFVFGFFSRLFEREADLHVFHLAIPPASMQHALDRLGTLTGNSHHHPSWHHGSIQERIDFLEKAKRQPALIARHHKKIFCYLFAYGFILLMSSAILMSPLLPDLVPFKQIAAFSKKTSQHINNWINSP